MKQIARLLIICLFTTGLFTACQKEYSLEDSSHSGVIIGGGTSEGLLGGDPDSCANAVESGSMVAGTALNGSNTLTIEMNFTKIGTYYVSTDTINGVYFAKTGVVSANGPTQITLIGSGTPATAGVYTFTVTFKNSLCSFDLTVATTAPPVTSGDYFPTTADSYWSYKTSDPAGSATDTLRNIATSNNYTINGNLYTLFTSESDVQSDSLFFSKGNGEYHQFGDLDLAGVATNYVPSDYIFLKDNVPVGTEWISAEGDASVDSVATKVRLKFSIAAKDVSVTVGATSFNNVIKVTTAEQVQIAAGFTTILSFESWYAKGVGLIKIVAPVPFYGYEINSYQIK